jgi:predicted nucleic acid-binding protein
LIAFADRSDTHHALFRRLFAAPPALVTTSLVVAEGHAWFLRRYDRTRALQFISMTEAMAPLRIVSTGPEEQRGAVAILRKFSDQDLTLADALGIHLMRERRIKSCWSTDRHLGLSGVRLVINES